MNIRGIYSFMSHIHIHPQYVCSLYYMYITHTSVEVDEGTANS